MATGFDLKNRSSSGPRTN